MKRNRWLSLPIRAILPAAFFLPLTLLAATPNSPGPLRIALNEEPATINPVVNTMMASVYIQDVCLRPLLALDAQGAVYPVLLTEVPSIEKKTTIKLPGGGLRVHLEFRADAKWGDGVPVTCQDLVAAWEIGRSDKVAAPGHELLMNMKSIQVDAQNPAKCDVEFAEAHWNYYLDLPRPISAHIEMPIFKKFGGEVQGYEHNSGYVHDAANPGLYNGPYRISEMKPGSHVALVPNTNFVGPAPIFPQVIFKYIQNPSAMEANLLTGGVDITSASGFTFDQALAFEKKVKREKLPFRVDFVEAYEYAMLSFNLDRPFFTDLRVRKALAYAINRKDLVKAFFEDRQKPALHFASHLDSWYTEDPKEVTIYPYDKKTANDLLDQAGWNKAQDGYRYRNGQKLSFTLSTVADNKLNETIETFLQNAWRQIGVELKIKNYPARVLFSEILRKRNFDLGMWAMVGDPDEIPRSLYSSDQIPSEANGWTGENRSGWRNSDVDKWLASAEHEFSKAKRIQLMKKVLKAYTEDLPAIALYYKSNTSVIPNALQGYHLSPHVYTEFLDIEKWKWDAGAKTN